MTKLAQRPGGACAEPIPQVLDPTVFGHWDRLLATHPGATFFHGRAWANTLVSTYGFECRYVAVITDNRLHALLPIMETRSWIRGTRAVCLPFTDACSALTSPGIQHRSLVDTAAREADYRGWKHLEICGEPGSLSSEPAAPSYYVHRLALAGTSDDLFDRCDSAVRRAVRKAERSGVTVQFATDMESVRTYYRLHCRTRTRHGSPPQPFRFFESIHRHILDRGHGFIALAFHDGRPISGAVFFTFNGKAIYKFSASDERFQGLRASNLVIWRTIEKLLSAGAVELDFGRTSLPNAGLRRFKLGWGAQESTISRTRYCFKERNCVTLHESADGMHTRVCASLPVFISRWIGSLAYPHLS